MDAFFLNAAMVWPTSNIARPSLPKRNFRIGSITKQFIAAAILKLREEGRVSLDDKLSKFLPEFPRGDEVTIHHLLTHTSGIHSFTGKRVYPDRAVAHRGGGDDSIVSKRSLRFDRG